MTSRWALCYGGSVPPDPSESQDQRPPSPTAAQVTRLDAVDVRSILGELGVGPWGIHLADTDYVCTSRDWLLGPFWRYYNRHMQRRGIVYGPHWDCDDFARDFANEASLAHKLRARRNPGTLPEGIAVFEHWYVDAKLGPHAQIVCLIGDGSGEAEALCIEPQPASHGPIRRMTRAEWVSTFFVR